MSACSMGLSESDMELCVRAWYPEWTNGLGRALAFSNQEKSAVCGACGTACVQKQTGARQVAQQRLAQ